jgi:predicted permease
MLEIMLTDYARARSAGRVRALVHVIATGLDAFAAGLAERLNPTWMATTPVDEGRWQMGRTLEAWARDFMHATRNLLRAPGFTLVTAGTLALAIGANTAIFSVVDAVLLRSLPYADTDRLVSVRGTAPGSDLPDEVGVTDEMFVQYRDNADLLEDMGMYGVVQSTARAEDQVERLFMGRVTAGTFPTLGATPALGRLPTDDDDENVVVLSDWLWNAWFGADSDVLGRAYEIAGASRTVVGVMRPEFRFPDERVALWINMVIEEGELTPGGFGPSMVARLAPGADHADVAAQLAPLARRLPEQFGGNAIYARIMEQYRPIVRSLREELVGDVDGPLWVLLGTVGIVLLIACANVANLFIVRAESRRQDLAVRRALGAGRTGLVRSQMAEALLLAALGGAGGALLALVGVPLLVRAAPEGIPRIETVGLDLTALLFTAGVSVVAACAFGLVPAIRVSNPGLVGGLRQGGGRVGGGPSHWGRDALVVLQTASALVLLVASGLLVQSFWQLSRVDPGFDTDDIFTFQIAPTGEDLNSGVAYARFHNQFMDRLRALPGVESVGLVQELPLDEGAGATFMQTERILASGADEPLIRYTFVGGDYFETMGIDVLSGRRFDPTDEDPGVTHAMVGRAAADLLWPGEDPIGQRLRPAGAEESGLWWSVVGVAEDVYLEDFRQREPEALVYLPLVGPGYGVGSPAYVVKTARAELIAPEIRALVREVEPNSPMYRIFTMQGLADRSMAQLSFTMLTLAVASGLALVLGAVGLYGVLSYVVSQRTREIGVRMALGAQARQVRRMVVAQAGRVTLLGVVVGVLAAVALTRVLETLLFGVGAVDPLTFIVMSAVMLTVALLASYLPARRASSVDPMRSLRTE